MADMKKTIFYHFFRSKDEDDELNRLNYVPRLHNWEMVVVRDEPKHVLQLFPWEINKVLISTDLGYLLGLQLSCEQVEKYIFKHWDAERITRMFLQKAGTPIVIHDTDTLSDHEVFFRKCAFSNDTFCFQGGWVRNFVARRRLEVGMKIGMYWDTRTSTLRFSVLEHSPESSRAALVDTPGSSKDTPKIPK